MQNNIGTVDRYVRLTAGLLALGASFSMRRQSPGRALLMSLGAMKVAEGVTGWCPLIQLAQATSQQTTSAAGQNKAQGTEKSARSTSESGQQPEQSTETSGHARDGQHTFAPRRVRAVRKRTESGQNGHTHDGRMHQSSALQ
ncbi:YgaP family membrane protein [Alicyclobacillus sp. ALC3]|uniref:YgaP family membrane protein n=1 Tax=Alicyclobacillus sp. ALC3 TaxID=2796143 RepID=UPI0023792CD5|nr:DUF2892 domain-containing protein [Alicyclobacillus sp. ALC3]WDL97466.1 DUF2892 domain-containing protein [Alicyclobacillus sp. ALC3]